MFTHLHVASSYSLRFGTATPDALAIRAAELGLPALALTDRDGLHGAFKHAQACDRAGIKPLLGADLAVAGTAPGAAASGTQRVTLLATGRAGWASLCRLITATNSGTGGGHGRTPTPVTRQLIAEHSDGLIALLGPDSDVGQAVAARFPGTARKRLRAWHACCETVIEVTDHGQAGSTSRAARMVLLADDEHVPAVLTNAVRYLDPADGMTARILDAARHLAPLGSPRLAPYRADHEGRAYLAGAADMAAIAARIGAATGANTGTKTGGRNGRREEQLLRDTAELAARCVLDPAADLGIGRHHLPENGESGREQAVLRARCEQALDREPGPAPAKNQAVRKTRLDHELDIISRTGMASYFLTVAGIADRIKAEGIRCSIRGSGAGSYVNYLLGISAVNPLEHGLLMERFLSPVRDTLPDIDLDVESARRLEAYRIIFDAYGEERTACVSMMETYAARSAIRDTAAAMSLTPDETGAVAKAFPRVRARNITAALENLDKFPELRSLQFNNAQLKDLFRAAEQLDGLPRHVAMHPCGILLSDRTLLDRTAVQPSGEGFPLSHLDKDDAEIAGVIKLDVLGVRMQSAMAHSLTEIKRAANEDIDLDAIPAGDEDTYEMIKRAETAGCFQIESPGQRELVKKLAPRDLADLIADISLFRPGPVSSDMITPFLKVRHGLEEPRYPHEDLKPALEETGGVIIFHEQVLRIIDVMTGCGLAEADLVRRALSEPGGPERTAVWFRAQAARNGYDPETTERVWHVLSAFGAFGFCKAHAAAFAVTVYQSAWLKRHHPAAFFAGLLTHDPGMYPKRVITGEARRSGVRVLPPDVNASAAEWRVENPSCETGLRSPGAIRVSLREVRGMSDAEVARITAGQPYESLRDFTERSGASRPVTENLVLAGAFDALHPAPVTRRDLLSRAGVLYRGKARCAAEPPLFSAGDGLEDIVPAGELRELDPAEKVAAELDILGFDVSAHVLDFYAELLEGLGVVRSPELDACRPGEEVLVAGVKVAAQTPPVRSGQRVIFATLDDKAGLVDLAFFESVQDRCAARVLGSWLLLVRGRIRRAGAGPAATSVTATDCWDLASLEETRRTRGMAAAAGALRETEDHLRVSGPGGLKPTRPGSVNSVRTGPAGPSPI